jgi:hypothetical protein
MTEIRQMQVFAEDATRLTLARAQFGEELLHAQYGHAVRLRVTNQVAIAFEIVVAGKDDVIAIMQPSPREARQGAEGLRKAETETLVSTIAAVSWVTPSVTPELKHL